MSAVLLIPALLAAFALLLLILSAAPVIEDEPYNPADRSRFRDDGDSCPCEACS
jgi:hypothetical protein